MKPAAEITDRAKRYRAQKNRPQGKRLCTFCASRENVDVDHVTGDEADDSPRNLMYLCRRCNTRKGIVQARNRIGVRTRQYNPQRTPTLNQFRNSAAVLVGTIPGDAAGATAVILATPPHTRERYAGQIETASNPFKSEAQRRKLFAMAARGEIKPSVLRKFVKGNPAAPSFAQYAHGVSIHQRGRHDEGGEIIHATPAALRHQYALEIARRKKTRGTDRRDSVPF
jgi:hypothetical protein